MQISAFAALIVALAAWIAYRNHLLNVEKHKLELFEKRFAVYKAVQVLLSRVLEEAAVKDLKTVFEYRRDTQVAHFLFDQSIVDYISAIDKKALNTWSKRESYLGKSEGEERTKLVIEAHDIMHELLEELPKLKDVFSPYLKFRTWK